MIRNQNGITLTEAIVTMIILGILAGGLLTILGLNATETGEGIANSRVQMQYENFVEQLSRDVRRATYVVDPSCGETFASADTLTENDSATHIEMFDVNKAVIAGYQINNGILEELVGGSYKQYMSGNKPIEVTPNSRFELIQGRKGVTARVHAKYDYKTVSDTIETNANFIRCRN